MISYLAEWGGILLSIPSISLSRSSISFRRLFLSPAKPMLQKSVPSVKCPESLLSYSVESPIIFSEFLSAILDHYRTTKIHLGIPVPFIESRARFPFLLTLGFITSSKNRPRVPDYIKGFR
jgi:hypothetical protein